MSDPLKFSKTSNLDEPIKLNINKYGGRPRTKKIIKRKKSRSRSRIKSHTR